MYKLKLLPLAKEDIKGATKWYDDQKKGLGLRLARNVRELVGRIQNNPFIYSVKYNEIRTAKVKDFPYLIHFTINDSLKIILIIAVIHTSRNPETWNR